MTAPGRFVAAALDYAALGIPVIPIVPKGKRPLLSGWPTEASTEPEQVKAWWEQWPDANIGVLPGRGGFVALDIDPRNGGDEQLAEFEAEHGPLPSTLVIATGKDENGHRGRHIWFRVEDAAQIGKGELSSGVEFKATSGYVLAPPSVHPSGVPYEVVSGEFSAISEAPTWVQERLRRTAPSSESTPDPSRLTNLRLGRRTLDALRDGFLPAPVDGQSHRDVAVGITRNLREAGTPIELTLHLLAGLLADDRSQLGSTPWTAADARKIVSSIYGGAAPDQGEYLGERRFEQFDLASHTPTPAEWLYEPILLAKTYTLVTAKAGAGKTMLALAIAHPLVKAGLTVAYLDQENGPDVLKERAVALGFSNDDLTRLAYFPYPNAGSRELEALVGAIEAVRPALVVFDAKANFLAAAQYEEDSAHDNTTWHRTVIQPLLAAGAAVLELDHTGHKGDRPRGSSAKGAVTEAEWLMSADRQFDPRNTATVTLKRGLKNRRGVLPTEVAITMGGDGKGGFLFNVSVERGQREKDEVQIARRRRIQEDVLQAVTAQWNERQAGLSLNQLTKLVRGSAKEITEVVKDMGHSWQFPVELVAGERNAIVLQLKESAR
ncbi:MAG: bifunctional DNA primase/polymerase [Patulibacter sp.]|nr:bifunctional DNA primase/polymerase [Patulibacter sp.]